MIANTRRRRSPHLYPPLLMMSALVRPRMRKLPLSTLAVSPVLNQPSAVNSFAVASGLLWYLAATIYTCTTRVSAPYPVNTLLPATSSSPASHVSTLRLSSSASATTSQPPSSFQLRWGSTVTSDQKTRATWPHLTILARTPGSGVPTWPGTRSPRSGCDSAMPISVMPYLAQHTCHMSRVTVQDTRVPLQQHVARDLLPPGQGGHRQGRRPAHHQPLVLRTLKH